MKKIYIAPKIDVIILDSLCSGGFLHGSVYRGSLNDVCISKFDVSARRRPKTITKTCGDNRTAKIGATINTPLGCHSS